MISISVPKTLLHVSDVASLLGYSSHTVYHLIKTKQLTAYKENGCKVWKIPAFAVKDYIKSKVSLQHHRS